MAQNTYIDYQKSTDISPMTLVSLSKRFVQFTVWFEAKNNEVMRWTNITPKDARQYKQHLIDTWCTINVE